MSLLYQPRLNSQGEQTPDITGKFTLSNVKDSFLVHWHVKHTQYVK